MSRTSKTDVGSDCLSLGLKFLGSRDHAWLTCKQVSWLLDTIAKDTRERTWPKNRGFTAISEEGGGWELRPCAPNGAAIIERIQPPTQAERRRREFERISAPVLRRLTEAAFDDLPELAALRDEYRAICREFEDVTGTK